MVIEPGTVRRKFILIVTSLMGLFILSYAGLTLGSYTKANHVDSIIESVKKQVK